MILRTGIKKSGFTLLEALITAAVLSFGIVLVFEAFFTSLNSFNYYSDYLSVAPWMYDKLWEAQNSVTYSGNLIRMKKNGQFIRGSRNFTWDLSSELIDATEELYGINLVLSWQIGRRVMRLSRTAYAAYAKKE